MQISCLEENWGNINRIKLWLTWGGIMIKAKITKIDGDVVHLLTEHNDEMFTARYTIDFGILEGDSIFLKTESGEYKFRRLEKDEVQNGESYYYDSNWKKREDEYQALNKIDAQKSKSRNYPLYVLISIIVLFLVIEIFRRNIFITVI